MPKLNKKSERLINNEISKMIFADVHIIWNNIAPLRLNLIIN